MVEKSTAIGEQGGLTARPGCAQAEYMRSPEVKRLRLVYAKTSSKVQKISNQTNIRYMLTYANILY